MEAEDLNAGDDDFAMLEEVDEEFADSAAAMAQDNKRASGGFLGVNHIAMNENYMEN